MTSIRLVNLDRVAVEILLRSSAEFEQRHGISLGEQRDLVRDLAQRTASRFAGRGVDPRWGDHLAVDETMRRAVGWCGFASAPNGDRGVEIVWSTFQGGEGGDTSRAIVAALVALAFASPIVNRVHAPALLAPGTSTRLLGDLGFVHGSTTAGPGDAAVRRWVVERSAWEARRTVASPWLTIATADYEGHMSAPGVGQLEFLSRTFAEILAEFRPATLAVIGGATGNGFEHIDPRRTHRVIGIDIHPDYLAVAHERHAARLPGLQLLCTDVARCELEPGSMDLVHAALVLEYVDPASVVSRASRWLAPGGVLCTVLQLPTSTGHDVTETGFESLKRLEPVLKLVDPQHLERLAAEQGLVRVHSRTETLASGKSFCFGVHRRPRREPSGVR